MNSEHCAWCLGQRPGLETDLGVNTEVATDTMNCNKITGKVQRRKRRRTNHRNLESMDIYAFGYIILSGEGSPSGGGKEEPKTKQVLRLNDGVRILPDQHLL